MVFETRVCEQRAAELCDFAWSEKWIFWLSECLGFLLLRDHSQQGFSWGKKWKRTKVYNTWSRLFVSISIQRDASFSAGIGPPEVHTLKSANLLMAVQIWSCFGVSHPSRMTNHFGAIAFWNIYMPFFIFLYFSVATWQSFILRKHFYKSVWQATRDMI